MPRTLGVSVERWPVAGEFVIARGRKTEAEVVVAEIREGGLVGRGECVPYRRYGEDVESVVRSLSTQPSEVVDRSDSRARLPQYLSGAALNALDAALWELESLQSRCSVEALAGLPRPGSIETAFTLSVDTPPKMASRVGNYPLLKLKLSGDGLDLERVRAVRNAAPRAALWLDANEAWSADEYRALIPALVPLDIALIEQPFPAGSDALLSELPRPIPICADESFVGRGARFPAHYDFVNVKLDKNGGLTGARETIEAARRLDIGVVLGCMVATSLSLAPACLLAPLADYCDLDGSILLARDRRGGCELDSHGRLTPPTLWGFGGGEATTD